MPRDPDRPTRLSRPDPRQRTVAVGAAAVTLLFAGATVVGCTSSTRPSNASAEATGPSTVPVAASSKAPISAAGPAFQPMPCPVAIDGMTCGEVDDGSGTTNRRFAAVVHTPPADQHARDLAVSRLDAEIEQQRAVAASVAPNGADPLAALGPVMRMLQLEEQRNALLAA